MEKDRASRDRTRFELGQKVFIDLYYGEIHDAMSVVKNPDNVPEDALCTIKHDLVLILELGKKRFGLDPNDSIARADEKWEVEVSKDDRKPDDIS